MRFKKPIKTQAKQLINQAKKQVNQRKICLVKTLSD